MLQYQTIESPTLELLKRLQKESIFSEMRLVGGTSLALQLGHRKSVDIDLFGKLNVDEYSISEVLKEYGSIRLVKKTQNIYIYIINGIKVDIVNYPYQWIEEPFIADNLILADKKDIAALKLAAITGRGTKKDFIDLYFLLQTFSLKEMLGFYNKKFYDGSDFLVLKSLSFFEDAETDEDPIMLKKINWTCIKEKILLELERHLKSLE